MPDAKVNHIYEYDPKYLADISVSYTHLRAHETGRNLVCRLLLEKKKTNQKRRQHSQPRTYAIASKRPNTDMLTVETRLHLHNNYV